MHGSEGARGMTKRAIATQAQVSRLIKAAIEAGLRVTRIVSQPDGTITVETDDISSEDGPSIIPNSWADRQ
jgi:hypothetical protein